MLTTDLEGIKSTTKLIARATKPTDGGLAGIAIHPFLENIIWFDRYLSGKYTPEQCNLLDDKVYKEWLATFNRKVDKCNNLDRVYMLWREPWKLTFMKYCGEFLGEKDFAEYMADAWTVEENPNMDVNVSRKAAISMFKKCKKEYLMTPKDFQYYQDLPNRITIYRGVANGRIELGLSWTDNLEKAEWFLNRFNINDIQGKLLTATIDKKNVIAYFNTRDEQEVLVDVFAIKKDITEL